jgi:nitric oxide reductase large subunit
VNRISEVLWGWIDHVTAEEKAEHLDKNKGGVFVVIDFRELEKVAVAVANGIRTIIDRFKAVVESLDDYYNDFFERKSRIEKMRASWIINQDTRKQSQVISNKSKFMVRKVIR